MKLPYIDLKEDRAEPIGSAIRVLVVDDFEPFRRFVCSRLGERSNLHVVGEAEDGLDAVCRAEELRPGLIILDIGLPKLNGIEAARRIRELSSSSKILFLSQNADSAIVQAALDTGALGYVHKMHAREELLTAVAMVMRGNQFIGRRLKDRN